MAYFPDRKWVENLFGHPVAISQPLISNFDTLIRLAKTNAKREGERPITQVAFGPDYNKKIQELAKEHGMFFLVNPTPKEVADPEDLDVLDDYYIVIPMPDNAWDREKEAVRILFLQGKTYDSAGVDEEIEIPFDGSIYDFYTLGATFGLAVRKEIFLEEHSYHAINKRTVL